MLSQFQKQYYLISLLSVYWLSFAVVAQHNENPLTASSVSAQQNQRMIEEVDLQTTSPKALKEKILEEDELPAIQDNLETIGIVSDVPLLYYKRQIEIAELDFYDLYNSLADEKRYLMYCRREAKVGSKIKRMACYPQYFLEIYSQMSQDAFANTPTDKLAMGIVYNPPSLDDIEFLTQRDKKKALKYVADLVKEHPALLEKLLKMNKAIEVYEEQKAKR